MDLTAIRQWHRVKLKYIWQYLQRGMSNKICTRVFFHDNQQHRFIWWVTTTLEILLNQQIIRKRNIQLLTLKGQRILQKMIDFSWKWFSNNHIFLLLSLTPISSHRLVVFFYSKEKQAKLYITKFFKAVSNLSKFYSELFPIELSALLQITVALLYTQLIPITNCSALLNNKLASLKKTFNL